MTTSRSTMLLLLLCSLFSVPFHGLSEEEELVLHGEITDVDYGSKIVTLKGDDGLHKAKWDEKTAFSKRYSLQKSDLRSGDLVKVNGKINREKETIVAKKVMLQDGKIRKGVSKNRATGSVEIVDGDFFVDAGEVKLKIIFARGESIFRYTGGDDKSLSADTPCFYKLEPDGDGYRLQTLVLKIDEKKAGFILR